MKPDKKVSIIVPVYADWQSLNGCVESLKKFIGPMHEVLFVNDNGPEADNLEREIIESIKYHKNFNYYRNAKNLGFVKTCNMAVATLDKTNNDIMLLNSDTVVTEGFLEEMTEVLYAEENIGAVSPRSNNATLATIPLSAAPEKGIDPKESFGVFLKIRSKLPRFTEVPTVHGFCMLTRRTLIKELGLFDEIYGSGYGEENDYCMRIREKGYICVLANKAYVYHLEAKSFTLAKKETLVAKNRKILDKRYPEYTQLIRNYMKSEVEFENHIESELGLKKYGNSKFKKLKKKLKYLTS